MANNGTVNSFDASTLIPALSAGSTSGLGLLVSHIAFASFIFSGPLQPYASQGIGLVLFGAFAGCLIVALTGGFRGAIAGLSPALVIVMAEIGATIDAAGNTLFMTTVVVIALGVIGSGALCILIGRLRLTNLVRFIPYPVASGFVAGIGGAVCLSAMTTTGVDLSWRTMPAIFDPAVLSLWAPGVLYGCGLYLVMRRWKNPLILPLSVVLAVGACHLALAAFGVSTEAAREAGLLLTGTAEGTLWPAIGPADLARTDWSAIPGQIPNLLALLIVALICVVMSLAGLEVALNEELDWDREFQAAGFASVVGGTGGGTFVCMIVPASFRSKLFGATSRVTGVACALVIGGGLFFGAGMLDFIPVALIGGMLIFAGLGMLEEGILRSRKRLPPYEYLIVLLIFFVIVAFGLIEGISTGLLATLVFFTLRLSRVDPIGSRFSGHERHSSKVRPPPDRAILLESDKPVKGYRLRGYLFFGSAWPLVVTLKQSLAEPAPPACLILDFKAVSGFDFSAVSVLVRFLQNATANGVRVILSATSGSLRSALAMNMPASAFSKLAMTPNEDQALERGEDLVIEAWRSNLEQEDEQRASLLTRTADDLDRFLERQVLFEELIEETAPWSDFRSYEPGDSLTESSNHELQFLVSGRASAFDSTGVRLCQCGPGDLTSPLEHIDSRAKSIVFDVPSRLLALEPRTCQWLEQHEKQIALKLYRYLFASRTIKSSAENE